MIGAVASPNPRPSVASGGTAASTHSKQRRATYERTMAAPQRDALREPAAGKRSRPLVRKPECVLNSIQAMKPIRSIAATAPAGHRVRRRLIYRDLPPALPPPSAPSLAPSALSPAPSAASSTAASIGSVDDASRSGAASSRDASSHTRRVEPSSSTSRHCGTGCGEGGQLWEGGSAAERRARCGSCGKEDAVEGASAVEGGSAVKEGHLTAVAALRELPHRQRGVGRGERRLEQLLDFRHAHGGGA